MKTILFILLSGIQLVHSQELQFNVSVSNDTLLLGNYLEVKFEIKNGSGKFLPPDFSGWKLVSGPNTASSYSFMNGQVSQTSSYTYYLEAPSDGEFIIESGNLQTEEKNYKTPPVKIIVFQNPEGIRQRPKTKQEERIVPEESVPSIEPKKKRKVTKL